MERHKEILRACEELKISAKLLPEEISISLIKKVLRKYNVQKTSGHLSIYFNSVSIPLSEYEFFYSRYLNDEMVYIFFDQEVIEKNCVVEINNAREVCRIMENTYGMEYFVTNSNFSYLVAVNWYVIEGAGDIVDLFNELKKKCNS